MSQFKMFKKLNIGCFDTLGYVLVKAHDDMGTKIYVVRKGPRHVRIICFKDGRVSVRFKDE